MSKEAQARIKINKLLEEAGWRFFDDGKLKANISLEHRVKKVKYQNKDLGNDLENAPDGFIDYLLLNEQGKPIALVEAKRESIDPLNAKEQAREYARGKNIRHIFLSNGNVHYYWNLAEGNPVVISKFLKLKDFGRIADWQPRPEKMAEQEIDENYIAVSQDARWLTYSKEQKEEVQKNNKIRLLRGYQIEGAKRLQKKYVAGQRRFLFEMATGTGKTLLSAAIIKMFIRSANADRVLFLVDRIELENQAYNDLKGYLEKDGIKPVIYKQNKTDWADAQVVITTIQSLSYENRYLTAFAPTDFQLIISDEAHRTIGGNNRIVFEYFIGSKLGLTATPRDYLKGVDRNDLEGKDPRQLERRLLLDTYNTFGCGDQVPTFRFSLEDAVRNAPPYLCMPKLLDIRTDITTDLLSKQGWTHRFQNEDGDEEEDTYQKRDFMKKFFSQETNQRFIDTFLENAKRDPLSNEIGKTIFFCVSRHHCTIMTRLLNEHAAIKFPSQYGQGSDFAVQITSDIVGSAGRTIDFKNNKLNGLTTFNPHLPDYENCKTRVCVTVGMMTTGYDCPDVLNVVLARPIFSPTDYIQIKGRGTRLHTFEYLYADANIQAVPKDNFYLFDFFANHQYFEKEFDYKDKIELPLIPSDTEGGGGGGSKKAKLYYSGVDEVASLAEQQFDRYNIMRVDKEAFSKKFEDEAKEEIAKQPELIAAVDAENWDVLWAYIKNNVFDKPNEHWNMEKIQEIYDADRRLTPTEIMMKVFLPDYKIKTRTDLVNDNFQRFIATEGIDGAKYQPIKNLFGAYLLFDDVRQMFNEKQFAALATDMRLSIQDLKTVGRDNIDKTLNYIKDNVSLNQFLPR